MLNSQDLKTVVPALQLARVLIDKQPEIFTTHFKREGKIFLRFFFSFYFLNPTFQALRISCRNYPSEIFNWQHRRRRR